MTFKTRHLFLVSLLAFSSALGVVESGAAVPQLLNHQGRIAVAGVNFNGDGQFKFALVDATGLITYWSNDGTNNADTEPTSPVTLAVTKGLYSVLLGDTALANMTALPTTVLSIGLAIAAPYEKGQSVGTFQAKDQFENAFAFKPADTRFLLVSHDMETGKKANAVLSQLGKNYLGSKKAVYMANIFGMPGIGRMFAMPKMKKYNHQIILADDEALITRFPQQTGKVTVLTLSDGKVSSIDYWAPGTEGIDVFLK